MLSIPPKVQIYVALAIALMTLAAKGSVSLPLGVPEAWGQYITSWSNFVLQVYAVAAPVFGLYSSSTPGPLAPADPPLVKAATARVEADPLGMDKTPLPIPKDTKGT